MSTRIIGIDPGFDRLGVCVLEKNGAKESVLFSACITTDRSDSFEKRLGALGKDVASILKKYSPTELALEKLFFAKNQTTAINVAEVRGVILYLASLNGLSVFEYSPPQIKVAITGYGKASKHDIAIMLPKIVQMPSSRVLDDELDAIAIALTHSAHRKMASWGQV